MSFSLGKLFTTATFLYRKKIVKNTLLLILEIRGLVGVHLFISFFSQVFTMCHILISVFLCIFSLSPSLQGFYGLQGETDIKHYQINKLMIMDVIANDNNSK